MMGRQGAVLQILAFAWALTCTHPTLLADAPPEGAERFRISLLTILPGTALYASFGHSAMRVLDLERGRDLLYNYGTSAQGFGPELALGMLGGRMPFMVERYPTEIALDFYASVENRTILEQVLRLSPDDASGLVARLERDIRPENRRYNYRFLDDNCATRIWDLLFPLMDDADKAKPAGTDRRQIRDVLIDSPWLRTLLDILFGPAADQRAPEERRPFLPARIRDLVSKAAALGQGELSFVSGESTLYASTRTIPPYARLFPLLAAIALLIIAVAAIFLQRPLLRALLDIILFSAASLLGALILDLWLAAGYPEVGWNLNLFWLNPLPLLAAFLARRGLVRVGRAILLTYATIAALLALAGGFPFQAMLPELRLAAAAFSLRAFSLFLRAGGFRALRHHAEASHAPAASHSGGDAAML